MVTELDDLQHISVDEAIELASGSSQLIDVREQWEWDAGHAPMATLLPLSELQSRVEELHKDATLLVVCHSGQRSLAATAFLVDAGYDAINVLGGMSAWRRAGGPLVTGPSGAEGSEPPHA